MSTSGISSSLVSALNGTPKTTPTTRNDQIDQQQFLTLFIAQLQNQDPLNPMDPQALTSQLAQLSSLEQLTGVNTKLDGLSNVQKQDLTTTMVGMIGKHVTFDASQLAVKGGQTSTLAFKLAAASTDVKAQITKADGTVVRTVDVGPMGAGPQTWLWDGRDDNGQVVPDGNYTAHLAATIGGQKVGLSLTAEGTVSGVDLTADPPTLLVGGSKLTFDRIRQVQNGPNS